MKNTLIQETFELSREEAAAFERELKLSGESSQEFMSNVLRQDLAEHRGAGFAKASPWPLNSTLVRNMRFAVFASVLVGLFLPGCKTPPVTSAPVSSIRARVTIYNPYEDRFHSRVAIGGRAREGVTMAAPSAFAFGSKVTVPQLSGVVGNGQFIVEDRGTALERAYRHGQIRLDVYVSTRSKLRQLKYELPEFMDATVELKRFLK